MNFSSFFFTIEFKLLAQRKLTGDKDARDFIIVFYTLKTFVVVVLILVYIIVIFKR